MRTLNHHGTMNAFFLRFSLAALLAGAAPLAAQITPDGVPASYEGISRLSTAFDVNADGLTDVITVDKAEGTFTVGTRQMNGSFSWSTPRSLGFGGIEVLAAGRFLNPSSRAIAVTSKEFNNIQIAPVNGDDMPGVLNAQDPEPQALAAFDRTGQSQGVAVGFHGDGSSAAPLRGLTSGTGFSLVWTNYDLAPAPRHAVSLVTKPGQPPRLGFVGDIPTPGLAAIEIFEADENTASYLTEWSLLPGGIRFVQGYFPPDVTAHGGGYHSTTLLGWVPASAILRTSRLTNVDVGSSTPLGGLEILPSAARTFTLSRPVQAVQVLFASGGSHRLLITWADATGGASVFSFDGSSAPTLIQDLNLNSLDLDSLVPLATNGDFLALGSRSGSPAWDLYSDDGHPGNYTRVSTGSLPVISAKALYSNIIAFQGEPLVNPDAASLKRARVADWTVAGTPPGTGGGSASVTALSDGGALSGLGNAAGSSVGVPGGTSHFLLNQFGPMASIAFLSSMTNGQSQLPVLVFQPPPGHYPSLQQGETFEVSLVQGGSMDSQSRYSLNGGPWQFASRFSPLLLTANSTIRAFASSYASGNGRVQTAVYTFGTQAPVATQPTLDSNSNGLSDAWENLTGITNPGGDADGDGFLNLAEHNSGFDPLSALSKPDAVAAAPNLNLFNNPIPAQNTLRWDASDTAVILQGSDDLQTWTVVTQGITQQGGENVFTLPVGIVPKAFYRLRR